MSVSYAKAPLAFKVQKVLRYGRLYGFSRTMVKIQTQRHVRQHGPALEQDWKNPACSDPNSTTRDIAFIGCGSFAYQSLAYYSNRLRSQSIKATYDIDGGASRSLCKAFNGALAVADAQRIIDDPAIKLVFVASNHASHTDYAVRCLDAGKHVHIEKPHVVSHEQLARLTAAMQRNPSCKVTLGFNRPRSRHIAAVKRVLDQQQGPMTLNFFVAGHKIPTDHWYFNPGEGGQILGNLCHWTDLALQLVGLPNAFPITVTSTGPLDARSDFVVTLLFADGSIASITFSTKGYTFEGVREFLTVHKGDALITMRDFEETMIEVGPKSSRFAERFRDHGHEANVHNSVLVARGLGGEAASPAYVRATGALILAVEQAAKQATTVRLETDVLTAE